MLKYVRILLNLNFICRIRTENEEDASMGDEIAAKIDVLCDRLVTIYEGMVG